MSWTPVEVGLAGFATDADLPDCEVVVGQVRVGLGAIAVQGRGRSHRRRRTSFFRSHGLGGKPDGNQLYFEKARP